MTIRKYRIDIFLVDDHAMFNEGLSQAINQSDCMHISRTFTSLAACRQTMEERSPDVLLLDISMPDGDSLDFCRWVVSERPKVHIVAVTVHDEYSVIQRMLDCGVHGYVLKSAPIEQLKQAITVVWQGRRYISPDVETIISQGQAKAVILSSVELGILRLVCDCLLYTSPSPRD